MSKGKIFILSGPSGSGKTTLYKKLLSQTPHVAKSISATTRPKRSGERHGRDYLFISPKMFAHKRRKGHFLESMKVFDNYYGTPAKNVRDLLKQGKNVLLCIDVKGAKVVRRKFPQAVSIFVKAPSLAVLKKRLKSRGSEDPATAALRLKVAREELKQAKTYKYVIVNDRLDHAFRMLKRIVAQETGNGAKP